MELEEARCPRCERLFFLEPGETAGALCCICKRDLKYEALYGPDWRIKVIPVEKALVELGKLRGQITTDMLRLPAPDPLRKVLEQFDASLSRTEADIRRTIEQTSPVRMIEEVTITGPKGETPPSEFLRSLQRGVFYVPQRR